MSHQGKTPKNPPDNKRKKTKKNTQNPPIRRNEKKRFHNGCFHRNPPPNAPYTFERFGTLPTPKNPPGKTKKTPKTHQITNAKKPRKTPKTHQGTRTKTTKPSKGPGKAVSVKPGGLRPWRRSRHGRRPPGLTLTALPGPLSGFTGFSGNVKNWWMWGKWKNSLICWICVFRGFPWWVFGAFLGLFHPLKSGDFSKCSNRSKLYGRNGFKRILLFFHS